MLSLVERIQALSVSLREALSRQDWAAVGLLDKQGRMLVREIVSQDSWVDHEVHEQINRLSELYLELQTRGRAERERLVAELLRLNQSKQVPAAYKPQG